MNAELLQAFNNASFNDQLYKDYITTLIYLASGNPQAYVSNTLNSIIHEIFTKEEVKLAFTRTYNNILYTIHIYVSRSERDTFLMFQDDFVYECQSLDELFETIAKL